MNPDELGTGLHLNISETDNSMDISLAMDTAKFFKVKATDANLILKKMIDMVGNWRKVAKQAGVPQHKIETMMSAFKV